MEYLLLLIGYVVFVFASYAFTLFLLKKSRWIQVLLSIIYILCSQIYLLGVPELFIWGKRNSILSLDFGHAGELLVIFWITGSITMIGFLVKFIFGWIVVK